MAVTDALAVSYAGELARWGAETTIVVPGSSTRTRTILQTRANRPTQPGQRSTTTDLAGVADRTLKGLAALAHEDADPDEVARATVLVVGAPFGKRPFRVHIDPAQDGAEIVNGVADRMRWESSVTSA